MLIECVATPHHGSSVLSEPEFVQTVHDRLGLKWKSKQSFLSIFPYPVMLGASKRASARMTVLRKRTR